MLSSSLSTPTTRSRRAKAPAAMPAEPAAHLNFSFDDWFKANTELPRQTSGWTPAVRLHEDYLAFCAATEVPPAYHLNAAGFSERMRKACGRTAEMRKIDDRPPYSPIAKISYKLCWPRFLRPAIRAPR